MNTQNTDTTQLVAALGACMTMLEANGFNHHGCGFELNRRFARVFRYDSPAHVVERGRSVVCFVEIATGDIYKSASWKNAAYATGGNVFALLKGSVPQR